MAATVLTDSIIYGTLAEILARSGLHTHQRAVATDYNNTWLYWNGSAWKWAKKWQPLALLRTAFTVTAASTSEETGMTYTLPAIGANDMLRVNHFWTVTNNGNSKNARVTLAGGVGQDVDLINQAVGNLVTEMRNMNNASVQRWFSDNRAVYGGTGGAIKATTKDSGTAGKVITVTGQKAVGGDTMTLEWADIWICGT